MEPIIDIAHLNKTFGDVHAVQDLSFQVRRGELFAFFKSYSFYPDGDFLWN